MRHHVEIWQQRARRRNTRRGLEQDMGLIAEFQEACDKILAAIEDPVIDDNARIAIVRCVLDDLQEKETDMMLS